MRYPPFRKTRLWKERKTIPVRANDRPAGRERTDQGRYFRCWNCGFVCDIERDLLSDKDHGMSVENYVDTVSAGLGTTSNKIYLAGPKFSWRIFQVDSAGSHVTIRQNLKAQATSGCPLCGTRAWKAA